ncbi:dihydrodipicolinate synthase family protein [Niabella terrae]
MAAQNKVTIFFMSGRRLQRDNELKSLANRVNIVKVLRSFKDSFEKKSMVTINWKGVFPAILTPFKQNEEIDYDMFEKNLQAQIAAGVHGLIIAGSLGEASALSTTEKMDLLRFAKTVAADRVPVLLNLTENTTRDAIRFAKEAQDAGADGLMVLPPMRYRADDREVVTFFKAVAQATRLPILIYNNPVDYGINITLDMFEALITEPNIQAIKESTRDLTNITRLRNKFGDRLALFGGVDTICLESLVLGADGLVAGLVDAFPNETVYLYELVKKGDFTKAIEIYRWFMPLLELDIHPKLVQYIKLAASYEGLSTVYTRAPRLELVGIEKENITRIIQSAIASRPLIST